MTSISSSAQIAAVTSNRSTARPAGCIPYPTPEPHAAPKHHRHLRLAESIPAGEAPFGLPAAGRPIPRTEEAARQADALAVALRGAIDLATVPLVVAARAFVEKEGWLAFGNARLDDHARERFGRSGRWVRDLAALGRMFSTLPGLEAAVSGTDGGPPVGRVAGLLIGRVASPESVAEWIERARRLSVREIREELASARVAGSSWPPGTLGVPAEKASPRYQESCGAQRDLELPPAPGIEIEPRDEVSTRAPSPTHADPGSAAEDGDSDDDDATRSLVRVEMPFPVLAAFDEALDLFRVLEGREATVTAFVEALVAEAASSSPLPEAFDGALAESLSRGEAAALRERVLARSTEGWKHLSAGSRQGEAESEWALHLGGLTLARLEALTLEAGRGAPSDLDAQIRELVALEDEIERRLAEVLARMAESGAWTRLRFDSAVHYAEQRLGMGRTATRQRLRVVGALRRLPEVRQAYARGEMGAEAAWLVAKMIGALGVDRLMERDWVERARLATVKRLRDEARLALRRVVGIEEESGAECTREGTPAESGGPAPVTDAEWYSSLHRKAGTARQRLARLGRMAASRMGSDVFLRLRLPTGLALDLLGVIESARRRLEQRAAEVPWEEPWPETDPPGSMLAARDRFVRCRRTPAWAGLLALLEDFVETWDVEHARTRRAGQAIHERSGWRCSAPGCTSRKNLENHHVIYRGRLGSNERWNRLSLCRFHHQLGEHGGLASVRGRAPLGITWSLGRLACGGWFRNELKLSAPAPGAQVSPGTL